MSGNWSYQHTLRRSDAGDRPVELRRQITHRDYVNMLAQRDDTHLTVYKTRRCFLWDDIYFQMDIYKNPCNQRCEGLILLEAYTTLNSKEFAPKLPKFLKIVKEVTNDPSYSMYNLSSKSEWNSNSNGKLNRLTNSLNHNSMTSHVMS